MGFSRSEHRQIAYECRVVVRTIRNDSNFENVLNILKSSPKEDLAARCPATDATLIFHAAQRQDDAEAEQLCKLLCETLKVCDPRHKDKNKQTALFFAARDGNVRCLKYLLSRGCDPNSLDNAMQTCLFYASRDGRTEAVRALLDAGAEINAVDHLGQTAIFYAARDGRTSTVALMLERGALINVKDRYRRSALYYAQKNNHKELVSLLKNASGDLTPVRSGSGGGDLDASSGGDGPGTTDMATAQTSSSPVERKSYRLSVRAPPGLLTLGDTQAHRGVAGNDNSKMAADSAGVDKDGGTYLPAPIEVIEWFERQFPEIAVWNRPAAGSPVIDTPITAALLPLWKPNALKILDELASMEGGWIFSKPVDCRAWGCPDYFDVIKNPMDFSKIKRRFKQDAYDTVADFEADMDLIFANCFSYNRPESSVAGIGKTVQSRYKELIKEYQFDVVASKEEGLRDWFENSVKVQLEKVIEKSDGKIERESERSSRPERKRTASGERRPDPVASDADEKEATKVDKRRALRSTRTNSKMKERSDDETLDMESDVAERILDEAQEDINFENPRGDATPVNGDVAMVGE